MFNGMHFAVGAQKMSHLSGVFNTAGLERLPSGKCIGSLQVPFARQVDMTVMARLSVVCHAGHLRILFHDFKKSVAASSTLLTRYRKQFQKEYPVYMG